MLQAILPVRSLLIAIFVMMAGSGFLSTLIALRLERGGSSTIVIGTVATAYFIGLIMGALKAASVVRRVGHIRAFAVFVALHSTSTLTYALVDQPALWGVLRLIDGICVAGIFICIESWLNESADSKSRGVLLATYMIALYSGQALGQFLLSTGQSAPQIPFEMASVLISLAIVPVCLTKSVAPILQDAASLPFHRLFEASPLGVAGAGFTGLMLGAFYGLAAIFVRRSGLDLQSTANFMTTVILGGVALQWPLGRLSDRFDRRHIIIVCFAATFIVSIALGMGIKGLWLFLLGAAFGGLAFALYPLCVAHANDRLTSSERVAASSQLVLLYSVGAALGPLGAAAAMEQLGAGAGGLFYFIAIIAIVMMVFGLWRLIISDPVPGTEQQDFQILPRTTPVASLLDPAGIAPSSSPTTNRKNR
ncbi:MFS transporter [Sphingopyxis yananensis]|uniref:MFS transporter n=1 Tax=Sphingopyxis yananensis TaxID=2886687 RepID=UPI001D0F8552|nr:MFS transporter [Sphingopyxis yananensis]MCC2602361.1 MFS transporter [Sphingopyxis yananensis]